MVCLGSSLVNRGSPMGSNLVNQAQYRLHKPRHQQRQGLKPVKQPYLLEHNLGKHFKFKHQTDILWKL